MQDCPCFQNPVKNQSTTLSFFLFALQIIFLTFEGVDTNIKLAFQANIIQSFHLILSYQNKDA